MIKRIVDSAYKNTLLIVISALFSLSVSAENVSISVTDKIKASANYQAGEMDKPAVLILHGFLSTNNFHTVKSISTILSLEGYSVLAPTLSLDINHRQSSLKCESIHTHTLEKDTAEILKWIDWLESKGHQKIVLIGHSSGSQQLLSAMSSFDIPSVVSVKLTSLFYLNGPELGTSDKEIQHAKTLQNKNTVEKFSFLFCKNNYIATPQSFLSYNRLTKQRILADLKTIQQKNIRTTVIMGGNDKRYKKVGVDWLDELKKTGAETIIINGANHFFSDEHEFELQEIIIESLSQN